MHNSLRQLVAILAALAPSLVMAVDVSGEHINPNSKFGKGAEYRLTGNTTFGWQTGMLAGAIDFNGQNFVLETGGGNHTVVSGVISGKGSFEWIGGSVPQVGPSVLGGEQPNSYQGRFTLKRGVLDLDKPAGVDAITGDLLIGTKDHARIRLKQSQQINDAALVTFGGAGISGIELQGHRETIESLSIETHTEIVMGDQPAALIVGDCSSRAWKLDKTLTIFGFKPGQDSVSFGKSDKGLSPSQLARIGFASPVGLPEGLYTATIGADGQLAPGSIVKAIDPPFDVSTTAIAARAKQYEVPGLAKLSGPGNPLKDGLTIAFFGDSITWQNVFLSQIDKAIQSGMPTKARTVKLINRGINGGGVLSLRDGSKEGGYPGNSPQEPFAKLLAADQADLAVVFIGINDVWWRNTTPEVFEEGLRDLVTAAAAKKTKLVLATMTLRGELPHGKNSDDPKIEQYSEITRKVAADTKTTLVDLRRAAVAYLQNHNAQLRVDGTLYFKPSGVLTYDGVHPNAIGNTLLANLISDGIVRALSDAAK